MAEPPEPSFEPGELPPHLKRLQLLVTVLTTVMILGVITIVLLLVMRLNAGGREILVHPEVFALPPDVGTVGYSVVAGRTVLVGDDGVIRVFDSESRDLVQTFELD